MNSVKCVLDVLVGIQAFSPLSLLDNAMSCAGSALTDLELFDEVCKFVSDTGKCCRAFG